MAEYQYAVNFTPLEEWGMRDSHLEAREVTSARNNESTVWRAVDTDRQSWDTVGDRSTRWIQDSMWSSDLMII